jgi:hypothetical protein
LNPRPLDPQASKEPDKPDFGLPAVQTIVLASGLDRPYPAGNSELLNRVGDLGLLVSELPPGAARPSTGSPPATG